MNKALFSSEKMDWETPDELFEELNKEFRFTVDVASSHENAKTRRHYTQEENGLLQNWGAKRHGVIRHTGENCRSGSRNAQRKRKVMVRRWLC